MQREGDSGHLEPVAHGKLVVGEEGCRVLSFVLERGNKPERHMGGDGQVMAGPFEELASYAALYGGHALILRPRRSYQVTGELPRLNLVKSITAI